MTVLNRDNIPAAINTLEGLMTWAMLTYTAAYGHIDYSETNTQDVQTIASYGISPVTSEINGSTLFIVGRFAVPLDNDLLKDGTVAWLGVVEHSQQAQLPPGYTV